jgi:D-alanyl-D-alanine carboxypeptidase
MNKLKTPFFVLILFIFLSSCSHDKPLPSTSTPEAPPLIHKQFSYTESEWKDLMANQKEEVKRAILADPSGFLDLAALMLNEDPDLFLIVDKQNSLPSNFIPEDLVNLDDIGVLNKNRKGHELRRLALPSLIEMTEAAAREDLTLVCSSAYRSYVYQVKTYNGWVEKLGREEADRVSAQPGKSQHQLGVAMDFGSIDDTYEFTEEGSWQLENAWKYGWSLSYPKGKEDLTGYSYESWHYRYIGKPAARMEKEFFSGIQHDLLNFWKLMEPELRKSYSTL